MLPVFWMSTVPVLTSPGLRFVALRTAPEALSAIESVPAVKVLAGFAAWAVKFAPDPTVMPTAARTTASAPMVRRGCAASAERRDTGEASDERGTGERPPARRLAGSIPFGLATGRWRAARGPFRPHLRGSLGCPTRSYRSLATGRVSGAAA